ncbi:ATP synthase subunit b [Gordonia effusa NBRC 100432]|uniref:ATP synthase subunit b n=1 Tax=Gordonia effusa NBRC 100432 TaxID=1077974 RepID=H0QVP1_9ACTN|nr:F0F1 ATP synthase subunit B [Gordonia effusa]GAB16892.1 ATP synthase subunit b [Gordonia effusa NBRC 100432]
MTTNLAAENFLIPNGTFFVCLVIFFVVFAVIGIFVVPPIKKAMEEREAMVAKTAEDNKAAAASFESADSEYRAALKDARGEATGLRDAARAKGNEELVAARHQATAEADAARAASAEALAAQGADAASSARGDLDNLATTLAGRILGSDLKGQSASSRPDAKVNN